MNERPGTRIDAIVRPRDHHKRLDIVATDAISGRATRKEVVRLIRAGAVSVDGVIVTTPSKRVRTGSCVSINVAAMDQVGSLPDIPVLFSDEWLVVVDKPAGLLVHPASGTREKTVADWAEARFGPLPPGGLRPGIVHRLDRNTSGVLVIALREESYRELKRLFAARSVHKVYRAIVTGHLDPKDGVIAMSLAKKKGTGRRIPERGFGKTVGRIREAETSYRVVGSFGDVDEIEVRPKTGRTHQIRAHLSAIGHPIVGDRLYLGPATIGDRPIDRYLLHSEEISFELFGKQYRVRSELPLDMRISGLSPGA